MHTIENLLDIMARLRHPQEGCPWDLEQDFRSIAPYTIEEAYEVADAIERDDFDALPGELGDLLLQVVFHARMAEEAGRFDFAAVVDSICTKLIARHGHVFGETEAADAQAVKGIWERRKAAERRDAGQGHLDDVPRALPALKRAHKLGQRAASVGFDWSDSAGVEAKVAEELKELADARKRGDAAGIQEEFGDLLFALASLARHLHIDPETALQDASSKFQRRFAKIETRLAAQGSSPEAASLAEMEQLWQLVKQETDSG